MGPQPLLNTPLTPGFMSVWMKKGIVFPAFLDSLESFLGGNTSWQPGAVNTYGGRLQSCYVLNFVLPWRPSFVTDTRPQNSDFYISVFTLVYTLSQGSLQHPFYLAIIDSDALHQILYSAAVSATSDRFIPYTAYMAFHAYSANVSTKGWSYVLLQLERQVCFFPKKLGHD